MCFADVSASAELFQDTVLAKQVLWLGLGLLCVVHFLLAVNEAAEVGLLAPVAQVERAAVVCEGLWPAVVKVCRVRQALVAENPLLFGIDHRLTLNGLLQAQKGSKLGCNRPGYALKLDLSLAAWAGHEGKGDPQCGPLVLQKLHDAVCVEDVAAGQPGTCLRAQL